LKGGGKIMGGGNNPKVEGNQIKKKREHTLQNEKTRGH